jgi:hypothetical protein
VHDWNEGEKFGAEIRRGESGEAGRESGEREDASTPSSGFINLGCRPSLIRSSELEDEPHTVLFLATRTQISVHQIYLGHAYSP